MSACAELAKDWKMDKHLMKFEAMTIVAVKSISLVITRSKCLGLAWGRERALASEGGIAHSMGQGPLFGACPSEYID
uniref:Uncharacterized protein n=1 Tax=Timema poppense TaxID=170557 RepID=A0A7R9DPW8_TIMPO|nr:unnamed protein product [Timema poppensis]